MNPPSALYGAMSRDKKPFTYTPGGLDLSEIKSERMAKRLMRNAMNQGVPEVSIQQIQSPPASSNPIAVPNFNCLPVQVFPTFNLPANPKSLLRTRSNPDHPREPPAQKQPQQPQLPKPKTNNNSNYQRPISMYENNSNTLTRTHHGNNDVVESFLPQISYEAEYFQTAPRSYPENKTMTVTQNELAIDSFTNHTTKIINDPTSNKLVINEQNNYFVNNNIIEEPESQAKNEQYESLSVINNIVNSAEQTNNLDNFALSEVNKLTDVDINKNADNFLNVIDSEENNRAKNVSPLFNDSLIDLDFSIKPLCINSSTPSSIETKPPEEELRSDDEQKEMKVVKKQVKKESKTEVQNGNQNGDAGVEAELTVKLPSKKSGAKTETKVEVVKKQLPDGSIEEIKTTTTKTTVDGKTKISTKTETTIIPKEEEEEVEVEEEEENEEVEVEEVEENDDEDVVEQQVVKKTTKSEKPSVAQNGNKNSTITKEQRTETQITKKVTVSQKQEPEEAEEEVEEDEDEEEVVETKQAVTEKKIIQKQVEEEEENEEEEEQVKEEEQAKEEEQVKQEEQVKEEESVKVKQEKTVSKVEAKEEHEEVEEEEEEEEEEKVVEEKSQKKEEEVIVEQKKEEEKVEVEKEEEEEEEVVEEVKKEEVVQSKEVKEDEESEYTDEEYESEKEEELKVQPKSDVKELKKEHEVSAVEVKKEESKETKSEEKETIKSEPIKPSEPSVPLREPSIPLDKVEDVEIKPISLSGAPMNETITKTVTKNTEITTTETPSGPLSTQTEYNRIENIVTVNRTTKTLDNTYEQLTQHGVPTVKTYFAPSREPVSTSPQPSKPYQPVYPPTINQPTERRHSLLLERLSTERQMPSDIYQNYQYSNQSYEQQKQWSQEPQAEVLTVSNVKPSKITNQQWYQNKDNVIYNNVTPTTPASQTWNQPSFQSPTPQPQPQPQPQYQPSYTAQENSTNTYQQNNYQSYAPKPNTWGASNLNSSDTLSSSVNTQQNQYSYLNQNTSQSYQNTSQQYSSSYVPPPWEQDSSSSYIADTSNQTQYQPPPPTTTFTPNTNQGWNPPPPKSKYTKTPPTSYIPPAPNQSFVKSVVEPPRVPGKKTYYSEYERRYITVPESNYVPGETKFQPQPDPSPQYYYDNNEPAENVEPQWRKELREFTEKTSQTTETISVQPPWEEESKYAKTPSMTYTPTPSWSQTLRPRSWRERSFESEYVGSQETQKTSTLGRGRPLSSYGQKQIETIPERPRGVSVDRYNPNNYQTPTPAEHPPVQSHTLNVAPVKGYHNPNVPAYHVNRASVEPREQPAIYQQPRQWGESRASPIQSRSFKYLQWITGTDE